MPGRTVPEGVRPVTRSEIVRGLGDLGVRPGAIVMVHARLSSLGWVVGGPDAVVAALVEAVGHEGTIAAYVGWHEDTYHLDSWPPEWRLAYEGELPAFDPAISQAVHEHGRLAERIRTWPGSRRSPNPLASVAAIGARAAWLAVPHAYDDGFGAGTPFARLVEAGGQVLMLGAPLETITLLHHAEAIAQVDDKRRVSVRLPVRSEDRSKWITVHDIDSSLGAFPYEDLSLGGVDAFEVIGQEAIRANAGRRGRIADAECHLFEARALVRLATAWMESRFGPSR